MRTDLNNFEYKKENIEYNKENNKEIKNFTYTISSYTADSGIKPILEARVIEPWHVIKSTLQSHKF